MDKNIKVSFKHVSKEYDLYQNKSDKIKGLFLPKSKRVQSFWALRMFVLMYMMERQLD